MGSKSYDSYSETSKGGGSKSSLTDTRKFGDGYVPDAKYGSANVVGTRLPNAGSPRKSKRKSMKY